MVNIYKFCLFPVLYQARGGSGEYVWGSSDLTTATVNFHGQITTTGQGKTNVTAADAKNAAHSGTISVRGSSFFCHKVLLEKKPQCAYILFLTLFMWALCRQREHLLGWTGFVLLFDCMCVGCNAIGWTGFVLLFDCMCVGCNAISH